MKNAADRLEELRRSRERTSCTDDRLYGIDGKICELEERPRPSTYQRTYAGELKDRQQILEAQQEQRRAQEEQEERELSDLIGRIRNRRWREILTALYIEGATLHDATAQLYAEKIRQTGKPVASFTAKAHRMRVAALEELNRIQSGSSGPDV